MIPIGKSIRMSRITKNDGRTLVVALDHGSSGIIQGIEDIEDVILKVIEGGADAIMVNFGIAKRVAEIVRGKVGLILSIPYEPKYVKLAIRLGADAIKTTYFGSVPLSEDRAKQFSEIALASEDWGVPYMAEVVPTDTQGKILYDVQLIKQAARIGSELGGDIIKTAYAGSSKEYKEVVRACKAPIVVMGGPKIGTLDEFLNMVKSSVEAGAMGGAIGRNIWQYKDPKKMTTVLAGIIHDKLKVEEALRKLE